MKKAVFTGVGLGPGDPELITLKAYRTLKNAEAIVFPDSGGGINPAARIISQLDGLCPQETLSLKLPMTRDKAELNRAHQTAAKQIIDLLSAGKSVCMPVIGDVSIYSTFSYLAPLVADAGFAVSMIPGVPSFCAAAAKLGISLTSMESEVHILPRSDALFEKLKLPGTKIIMKSGRTLPEVKKALCDAGVYEKTAMVVNCGLPGEEVYPQLDQAPEKTGYFTLLIVRD